MNQEEIARIYKKFWEYADEHSLEKIVDAALLFEPDESKKLPYFNIVLIFLIH